MSVLDLRQLNRATLARQGLLERRRAPVADVIRDVGGLQAQLPAPPLIGLWSRIEDFQRDELLDAVRSGSVVRGTSLRGTLHLHEVDDYRSLRMTLQPMLDQLSRGMGRRMRAEDEAPARALGRKLFAKGPVSVAQLKAAMAEHFPGSEAQALSNLSRLGLPLLIDPDPQSRDGWKANAPFRLATDIIGDTFAPADPQLVVRRFLEVLGPGSPKDAQTWSTMRGLKAVMQGMHDAGELIVVTTWEGDELYDLPDAPRPSDETAAPPRFLPMWDNVLLSHADRSRVIDPAYRPYLASKNGMSPPTFLIDGFVQGTWKVEQAKDEVTLVLTPFARIPAAHEDALVAEGEALLAFLHPDVSARRVRVG
jgi:hypothetical protein